MSNNMKDPLEPSSVKSIIAALLLSLAIALLFSQFVTKSYTLRHPSKLSTKSFTQQAYAAEIPAQIAPQTSPEPTPEPPKVEVAPTPPPAPTPQPEPPKPVAKPKSYPMPEYQAKAFIYQKESGNNPAAVNKSSGACGLGQSLPCSKMASICPNWRTDYECQDRWFTGYMQSRYGSWSKAVSFWKCTGQCGSTYKKATWW